MKKKENNNVEVLNMVKKTLALMGATTIIATSTSACARDVKKTASEVSTKTSTSSVEDSIINSSSNIDNGDQSSDINESVISNSTSNKRERQSNSSNTEVNSATSSKQNSSSRVDSSSDINQSNSNTASSIFDYNVQTMPTKLTQDNINAVNVFNYFAENIFTNSSYDIMTINYTDINGKRQELTANDYRLLICLLNNNYLNSSTYNSVISYDSLDNILVVAKKLASLVFLAKNDGFYVNYNDIVIDNNKKSFLSILQQTIASQNDDSLKKIVEEYFTGENKYMKYTNDAVMDYTVLYISLMLFGSDDSFKPVYIYYYNDIFSNFDSYVETNIYNKIKGKQLIK